MEIGEGKIMAEVEYRRIETQGEWDDWVKMVQDEEAKIEAELKQRELEEMQDKIQSNLQMGKDKMDAMTKINSSDLPRKINDACMLEALQLALSDLRECKPEERSERARHYVVTITEMEKVVAYFKTWVVDGMKIGE